MLMQQHIKEISAACRYNPLLFSAPNPVLALLLRE